MFLVRLAGLVVVALPLFSAAAGVTRTWTDGAFNDLMSVPNNWSPAGVPASDDVLVFPSGNWQASDDFAAGATFGSVTVNGSLFLYGNPTTVQTLSGSGSLTAGALIIAGDSTFSGTIGGGVDVEGSMPNANILTQYPTPLSGNGTVGNVTATLVWPGTKSSTLATAFYTDPHTFGTIKTGSFALDQGGAIHIPSMAYDVNPNGPSDLIQASGTVTLGGARLDVTVPSGVPAVGQTFRIIDNRGSEPVNGTFRDLPEGAVFSASGYLFRITYIGGDGNDVELTSVVVSPDATASQNSAGSVVGEPVTLSASITSSAGTPAGSVTFTDNGHSLGTTTLVNGAASLVVSSLSVGDHAIAAVYSGAGPFLGVTSSTITHLVSRGDTTTMFTSASTPRYGETQIHISTSAIAPAAGAVAGALTLSEKGNVLATAPASAGEGTIDGSMLKPGSHTLTASYGGSSSFNESTSDVFDVVVGPAAIQLDASSDGSVVKVFVNSTAGVPEVPTGTVTITEKGDVLAQQSFIGSAIVNSTLVPGHHTLRVSYSGDEIFEAGAADIEVDVNEPTSSRHRGAHH
ncbi:MAG TPA: Ig-like domain-containing protein [Vicinamibacterales bacterium]